jgi:hypothetical protein
MTDHKRREWHREVISASTESTISVLKEAQLLNHFYLAGGTGLAIQFGHRLSLDLDFFSLEHFDEEALLQRAQDLPEFALTLKAPYTIHAVIGKTKVSFLGYAYPVLFPSTFFLGVAIADPRDIACMKVSAIAGRGSKRDFVDLYVCAKRFGLAEILRMFSEKYARTQYNRVHLLKSLTFFNDAEKDPMPNMLVPLDWEKVKQFFLAEVPRLL